MFIIAIWSRPVSVAAAGGNGATLGERVIPLGQKVPKGGGYYQVGKPYRDRRHLVLRRAKTGYDRVGSASWYGELFHGRRTANGEIYDMDRLSAAHPTLPLPVYARVTNLNNGRTIVVRINDRGPYANDRIIDLSRRSAELLGFRNGGSDRARQISRPRASQWRRQLRATISREPELGRRSPPKGRPNSMRSRAS